MKKLLSFLILALSLSGIWHVMAAENSVIAVCDNALCDEESNPVILKGISIPGGEGYDPPQLNRVKTLVTVFTPNVVRFPLNQVDYAETDSSLRQNLREIVDFLTEKHVATILDLHWSEGNTGELKQWEMPDASSLVFWKSIAAEYKDNLLVLFELYNEPHDSQSVWLNGGSINGYESIGMQTLADAIRAEGSLNVIIANGDNWGFDHRNVERLEGVNVAYGSHPYGQFQEKNNPEDWDKAFGFLMDDYPVIITEFGDTLRCKGVFNQSVIDYAEQHHLSWVAWAAYPADCGFPGLITDWNGTPTEAGNVILSALNP